MVHENQETVYRTNNVPGILAGVLIGSLAGAVTMLLLAPQSGKDTRTQIKEKGIEMRQRASEMLDDTLSQVRESRDRLTMDGRKKAKELLDQGKEIVAEQLEHVSEAAQAGKKAIQGS